MCLVGLVHWFTPLSLLFEKKLVCILYLPTGINLLKVNNRNTRARCKICSKLTIQTPERRHWHRSGLFIVNFEHNSHLALVFILTSNLLLSAGIHNILSWPSIKCNICVLQSSPSCRLETTYSNSALARLEQLH